MKIKRLLLWIAFSSISLIIVTFSTNNLFASNYNTTLPPWTLTGADDKFPEDKYLTAVGEGSSLESSDKMAMIRVVEQIQVSVKSALNIYQQETERDGLIESSRDISHSIVTSVDVDRIEGLSIMDRFFDKKSNSYYSLAVLDRERAAEGLQKEINDSLGLFNEYYKSAEVHKSRIEIAEAIPNYIRSIDTYRKIRPRISIFNALANKTSNIRLMKVPTLAQVEGSLISLISRCKLEIVSGNNQKAAIGQALIKPLIVRAVYESQNKQHPINGFPIKYKIVEGSATIQKDVLTDREGIARSIVSRVMAAGIKHNNIEASLNYPESELPTTGPSARFTYILPIKEDIKINVSFEESNLGNKVDSEIIEPLVINHLRDKGFNVLERGIGKADFTIQGKINSLIKGQFGDMIFAVSNGSVKIIDNKSGLVVKEIRIDAQTSKGGGLTEISAGLNSLKNIGNALGKNIAREMEKLFNNPMD